jgi:phosphoribosyl 1,2-cyclic phosphate phosphodiesterase
MDMYATRHVQNELRRQYPYIFENRQYPGLPSVNFITFENKPFTVEGIEFVPVLVHHFKLPVFGFRIGDFTYITDANHIGRQELEKVKGSKVVVLNALRESEHLSHFSLEEAVSLMHEIGPQEGYFIHMSHQMGRHEEVNSKLPQHLELAYDGQQIVI